MTHVKKGTVINYLRWRVPHWARQREHFPWHRQITNQAQTSQVTEKAWKSLTKFADTKCCRQLYQNTDTTNSILPTGPGLLPDSGISISLIATNICHNVQWPKITFTQLCSNRQTTLRLHFLNSSLNQPHSNLQSGAAAFNPGKGNKKLSYSRASSNQSRCLSAA